jgi:5-hydroxyisourate hydrolase
MAVAFPSPITCHVLDTTTGRPAASLSAKLTFLSSLGPATPFHATTDVDGRIKAWTNEPGPSMQEIFAEAEQSGNEMIWALTLQTGEYFGEGKTFFPEVEVRFWVEKGQKYHVPVLLGPWSYTTYRGS